jgi:hypothetical protein
MSLAAKAGRAEDARDSNIRRTGLLRVRPYTARPDSASGSGAAFIRLPLLTPKRKSARRQSSCCVVIGGTRSGSLPKDPRPSGALLVVNQEFSSVGGHPHVRQLQHFRNSQPKSAGFI